MQLPNKKRALAVTRRLDVIAVGAINEDYIMSPEMSGAAHEMERVIPKRQVRQMLNALSQKHVQPEPSGSAFNTARAIASLAIIHHSESIRASRLCAQSRFSCTEQPCRGKATQTAYIAVAGIDWPDTPAR